MNPGKLVITQLEENPATRIDPGTVAQYET